MTNGNRHTTADLRFVDLHCDTISEIRDHPDADHHITLEKLECGGVILQCFALFTDLASYPEPEREPSNCMEPIARFCRPIEAGSCRCSPGRISSRFVRKT